MSQATARLTTTGMHCSSCSMLIDMTLADVSGVESSHSDYAEGSTVVVFDDEVASVQAIVDAIRSVGYEAKPTV